MLRQPTPFVWGPNGQPLTPDQVEALREATARAAERGSDTSPVGHWTQGLARLVDAWGGYKGNMRADKAEEEGMAAARERMSPVLAALAGGYGGGGYVAPQAYTAPDPNSPEGIAADTMAALGKTPEGWDGIKAGIFAGESGGDYNALFGFSNRPGGAFAGTRLTDMTVDQALAFADPSGPYAQHVKGQVGRVATPMGAYQVVGTTLRGAKDGLGLTGSERMTPELQDLIGQYIYQTQGTGAWEGYRGPQSGGVPGGNAGVMQALLAAQADPWAVKAYGPVMNALMGQEMQRQMQALDPAHQLAMERERLEIDALRNPRPEPTKLTTFTGPDGVVYSFNPMTGERTPMTGAEVVTPKLPTDVQEYEYAAQQYRDAGQTPPTFTEWQAQQRKAGASNTNVTVGGEAGPQVGTIPQGYQLMQDPATGAYRMEAIPGGPEDMSAKSAAAESSAMTASDIVTTAAQRARQAAEGRNFGSFGTTMIGSINPLSDSAEVMRNVDVLKSQAAVGNLQAMRNASPTGGALGSVTEKELKLLQDKSGALDPNSPTFPRDLDDYERTLLRTIHGMAEGDRIYDATRGQSGAGADGWTTINGVRVREKK